MRTKHLLALTAATGLLTVATQGCSSGPLAAPSSDEAPGERTPVEEATVAPATALIPAYSSVTRAPILPPGGYADSTGKGTLKATALAGGYAPHLSNPGGPVISNVQVVDVFWSSNVDATTRARIPLFQTGMLNSAYMDWLSEYGPIGRGSYGGVYTIAPTRTPATLYPGDVVAELGDQIAQGSLPAPNANMLYLVHLPPGQVASDGSTLGCQHWCGYHNSGDARGYHVRYALIPDFGPTSACASGCGPDPVAFNKMTVVESHEIIEAVTDPDPGTGWVDRDTGYGGPEIGDICNQQEEKISTVTGTYAVQKQWSNSAKACITSSPGGFVATAPGCATAIGSGGPVPWILGCSKVGNDYQPYRWTGSAWQLVSGLATAIAVSPEGNPWVVNSSGTIFKWNPATSSFAAIASQQCASKIGVGADDDAWIIGCQNSAIYHLVGGTSGTWQHVNGAAKTISVQNVGGPWVVNASGQVFAWDGTQFITPGSNNGDPNIPNGVAGCAQDIAVTSLGFYIVGCTANGAGGNAVYQYRTNFAGWEQIAGAGTKIAVTSDGTPWVVNAQGSIFVHNQAL